MIQVTRNNDILKRCSFKLFIRMVQISFTIWSDTSTIAFDPWSPGVSVGAEENSGDRSDTTEIEWDNRETRGKRVTMVTGGKRRGNE